jgi:hypothetical protein
MRKVTESDPISIDDVRALARERFGDMVKGVVDLGRGDDPLAEGSATSTSDTGPCRY